MSQAQVVLVTGASGFLGSHVVDQLLDAGYKVRGTARSAKANQLRASYTSVGDKFEVAVVDDLASSDLTDAFRGVDVLVHVGSPLAGNAAADVVMKSAVSGTRRVLEYALAARVRKVVVTSSIFALLHPRDYWSGHVFGADDWNTQTYEEALSPEASAFDVYSASKKLAEEEVWKFAEDHPEIDFATVLAPFLYGASGRGQARGELTSGTNGLFYPLLSGRKGRAVPEQVIIPGFVHVSDAARAHVLALKAAPSKKPKRIVVQGGNVTWKQAVEHLNDVRPDLGERLPVVTGDEKEVGSPATFDTSSAARLIGLTEYIGWEETVEATIDDLIKREKELGVDAT